MFCVLVENGANLVKWSSFEEKIEEDEGIDGGGVSEWIWVLDAAGYCNGYSDERRVLG